MRMVYFSPVLWGSFAQRSHKFVEWFHNKHGGDVLWIEPYPTRLPAFSDIRRVKSRGKIAPRQAARGNAPRWLTVLRPIAFPMEPLSGGRFLNRLLWGKVLQEIDGFVQKEECLLCIGKPSELGLAVLARHPARFSLYDAMDDFPAFYQGISRAAMAKKEQEVASRVSRISVSSTFLAKRFAGCRSKLSLAPNACAVDHLPSINAPDRGCGKPVLGYVGTIGRWFDWDLVVSLAEKNPSMCIRLIGPTYAPPPPSLSSNVELLPPCDHASAVKAMQEFSIGLIPFKLTDLTASVDPIKYYEYRALGLPVLSSPFGEMALRGGEKGVFLMDEHSDLVTRVKKALTCKYEKVEIEEFRKANSWEARFDATVILP